MSEEFSSDDTVQIGPYDEYDNNLMMYSDSSSSPCNENSSYSLENNEFFIRATKKKNSDNRRRRPRYNLHKSRRSNNSPSNLDTESNLHYQNDTAIASEQYFYNERESTQHNSRHLHYRGNQQHEIPTKSSYHRGYNTSHLPTSHNHSNASFGRQPHGESTFRNRNQISYSAKGKAEKPDKLPMSIKIHLQNWKQYLSQVGVWYHQYSTMREISGTVIASPFPPRPPRQLVIGFPLFLSRLFIFYCFQVVKQIFRMIFSLSVKAYKRKRTCSNILTFASYVLYLLIAVIIVALILGLHLGLSFLHNASEICKIPSDYDGSAYDRPLVEYYVHGHGHGHYSRSIAIIDKLNAQGIDVRMFLGRAYMWEEINQATRSEKDGNSSDASPPDEIVQEKEDNVAETISKLLIFGEANSILPESTVVNAEETDISVLPLGEDEKMTQIYRDILSEMPWTSKSSPHPFLNHHQRNNKVKDNSNESQGVRGTTTAISVTSLTPHLSLLASVSHLIERIFGDCEASLHSHRWPILVVSDGDLPGMIRAKLGKIPSVSISHGMTFAISKPRINGQGSSLLDDIRNGKRAWSQQKHLNTRTGFFSDWQIGTNFFPLEVVKDSAAVVWPPMREEVKQMGKSRKMRIEQEVNLKRHNGEGEKDKFHHEKLDIANNVPETSRNKIVLIYFRDKNGNSIEDVFLKMGFDVIVFNSPKKEIGKQWKIPSPTGEKLGFNFDINEHSFSESRDHVQDYYLKNRYGLPPGQVQHSNELNQTVREGNMGVDKTDELNTERVQDYLELNKIQSLKKDRTPRKDNNYHYLIKTLEDQEKSHQWETEFLDDFFTKPHPPRRIEVHDRNLFVSFMAITDGIISSGGSQLLSECIFGHIPVLSFYKEHDSEQLLNIEMIRTERMNEEKEFKGTDSKGGKSNTEMHTGIYSVFGMSIESFATVFGIRGQTSYNADVLDIPNNEDNQEVMHEFNGFVDVVKQSVISQNYYSNLYRFLKENSMEEQHVRAHHEFSDHIEDIFENDLDENSEYEFLHNAWLDGMPDAAAVVGEIVRQVVTTGYGTHATRHSILLSIGHAFSSVAEAIFYAIYGQI